MGDAFTSAASHTGATTQRTWSRTDTMKNFIHRRSLAFRGSTLEGWLLFLGRRFLDTYPQMERLRVSGEELQFDARKAVPDARVASPSEVLFHRRHDDRSRVSTSEMGGTMPGRSCSATCARGVWASSSSRSRVAFPPHSRVMTTRRSPSTGRMLFTFVDISAALPRPRRRGRPDRPLCRRWPTGLADLAAVVFHEFVSLSIQHLVHEIGSRILGAVPGAHGGRLRGPEPDLRPVGRVGRDPRRQGPHGPSAALRPHRPHDAPGVGPGGPRIAHPSTSRLRHRPHGQGLPGFRKGLPPAGRA
ncbi:MAG: hypothetical protein R3C32_01830 [Chloroflexota bacterium]